MTTTLKVTPKAYVGRSERSILKFPFSEERKTSLQIESWLLSLSHLSNQYFVFLKDISNGLSLIPITAVNEVKVDVIPP